MSSGEAVQDAISLCQMFDQCINLFDFIEETSHPSNSSEYQDAVKKAIELLEKSTLMVNQLALFSSNETIEEVATSDLKYLLLPAFLGYFTSKLSISSPKERLERLTLSELYFKDFLKRCQSYEVPDVQIPNFKEEESSQASKDLALLNANRNEKIKRYKILKEIDEKLSDLKTSAKSEGDYEKKREYYLILLKKWVLQSCDELSSTKTEKKMLENRPVSNYKEQKVKTTQPLKPIVIVRNEMQKKVFGMGYPSLPTMTVDEFYQQRYPDAENGHSNVSAMQSLQRMAADPEGAKKEQEEEDAQQEHLQEIDDPTALLKARAFDDWKDENRRGCGNRMNKG